MKKVDLLDPSVEPSDSDLHALTMAMVAAARAQKRDSDERLNQALKDEAAEVLKYWRLPERPVLAS